jgi:hypothetical protein
VALKGEVGSVVGDGGNRARAAGFCGPCVFGCISVVVVEVACVRNCRDLGLSKVGIVG